MIKKTLAVAALGLALQTGPMVATSHSQDAGFVALQSETDRMASEFLGTNVKNPSGEVIGVVTDLMFGDDGRMTAAVLNVGGVVGIGGKKVAIPFSALTVEPGKDGRRTLTANLDKAALEKAPIFQTIYDQKGGVTATMKRELSKWGKKAQEAAKQMGEKAKDAYSDAKKSMEDKKPAQ